MPTSLRVCIVDDTAMHRGLLRSSLAALARLASPIACEVVTEFENGRALLDGIAAVDCDLVTLDIRMPVLDGLSTLMLLKRKLRFPKPVVMVSSEQQGNIDRFERGGNQGVKQLSEAEKLQHLAKVEERLISGQVEAGKVSNLLEGCEVLAMDPVRYARHLGASNFLTKPYKPDEVAQVFSQL